MKRAGLGRMVLVGTLIGLGGRGAGAQVSADLSEPFGFKRGMTLEQIGAKYERTKLDGVYIVRSAPRSESDYDEYILLIAPKTGLCKVAGVSNGKPVSPTGSEIQSTSHAVESQLKAKYGDSSSAYDRLGPSSGLGAEDEWVAALAMDNRNYAKALKIATMDHYVLSYQFDNLAACRDELDRAKRGSPGARLKP